MPRFQVPRIASSEITPHEHYMERRAFLRRIGMGSAALAAGSLLSPTARGQAEDGSGEIEKVVKGKFALPADEKLTPYESMTTYGNFYEFGPNKSSPGKNAHTLRTRPWTISVEGEVKKPTSFGIEDILKSYPLEERVYRLRCVEGWSAVIPWVGFPLAELIKRAEPTGNAKYVEFISLADPEQMPYTRVPVLDWPYKEALRMDEAMNPLALLAVGMYGKWMPKQNGAPIRLVLPWKYGFKSAKSIVKLRFVEKPPTTTWMQTGPDEYGFYANVNPEVPHPRWSQSSERRLGEFLKRKTLMFNGYAEQVASLYQGMDLAKNF